MRLDEIGTLGEVLDWAGGQTPPVGVETIVTQDEYTHDVVLPFPPARWLVFDVT